MHRTHPLFLALLALGYFVVCWNKLKIQIELKLCMLPNLLRSSHMSTHTNKTNLLCSHWKSVHVKMNRLFYCKCKYLQISCPNIFKFFFFLNRLIYGLTTLGKFATASTPLLAYIWTGLYTVIYGKYKRGLATLETMMATKIELRLLVVLSSIWFSQSLTMDWEF